jgi:hypothetical protein
MLEGLDPVLESIKRDLDRVTDFSSLMKLQKDQKKQEDGCDQSDFDISTLIDPSKETSKEKKRKAVEAEKDESK